MMTVIRISVLLLALAFLDGCATEVSRDRILVDAQNEFHKGKPGIKVCEAELKDRVYESPTIISAQVLLTVEKPPDDYTLRKYKGKFVKYYYRLTYKKLETGWELVDVGRSM